MLRPLLVSSLAFLTFAGCGDPDRRPALRATASLSDMREELIDGRKEIDVVLQTLSAFEARPMKLSPLYSRYRDEVGDIESRAEDIRERAADMRQTANAYRESWSQDTAQITNDELRAAAVDRNRRVSDRYDRLNEMAQEVRAAYDPFMAQLHDVQRFLSNDLTYAGLEASKGSFDKVRTEADRLKGKVDALIDELDESRTRLSPTTAPLR